MVYMAFWSKKKSDSKILSYFIEYNIPYEIVSEEAMRIRFELCLADKQIMIYPYITAEEDFISFNVNITEHSIKGFDYEVLNRFNMKSKYFKAFITETGIIILEYRFLYGNENEIISKLIDSLFALQDDIDAL